MTKRVEACNDHVSGTVVTVEWWFVTNFQAQRSSNFESSIQSLALLPAEAATCDSPCLAALTALTNQQGR